MPGAPRPLSSRHMSSDRDQYNARAGTNGTGNGSGPGSGAGPERAFLLAVETRDARWSVTESFDELAELARTAGAEVVGRLSQRLEKPDPRTYLGKGKLEEAKQALLDAHA